MSGSDNRSEPYSIRLLCPPAFGTTKGHGEIGTLIQEKHNCIAASPIRAARNPDIDLGRS